MKRIIRTIVVILSLFVCFTFVACGSKYVSNYSAVTMVKTNTSNKASISFSEFKGTYVIKLQNKNNDEVYISYEATLQEGDIKVYYDFDNEKQVLFEIKNEENLKAKSETFTGNKTIYIVIESNEKSNKGSFSFTLEKVEK